MTAADLNQKQLYNRQEYVIGAETQAKYGQSDFLIVGLSGLGCEIAKNLALTGVRSISLLDDTNVQLEDLSTLFFASPADVGSGRAAVLAPKLSELNRFVRVNTLHGAVSEQLISQFTVVIFVDQKTTLLVQENEWARKHQVKFVACESRGVTCAVFVDGGDSFRVLDTNGEEPVSCVITGITSDGTIVCHDDKKHECEAGSKVYFTGVREPSSINSDPQASRYRLFDVASVVNPYCLRIAVNADELASAQVGSAAYLHTTRPQKEMSFRSLAESLKNPSFNFVIDDESKCGATEQLHAIFQYVHKHGAPSTADELKQALTHLQPLVGDLSGAHLRMLLETFTGQLNGMVCLVGGLASQEALKLCSGKFTPLDQWFYYDAREILDASGVDADRTPMGTRYDGQVRVIGRKLHQKIRESTAFIVGAGALGCELIKNAALMGFQRVSITDMDTIEVSNLSRQFLFRDRHVGQHKSRVAAAAASEINSECQIVHYEEKVAPETEKTFSEEFWLSQTCVFNALDNVVARKYVDGQCLFNKRPLFESGTLGVKCNVQVVIPFITESYSSSNDPPEDSIPLCTLKNFPNSIDHTIQWARDAFHLLFDTIPNDVNAYLEDPAKFTASLDSDPGAKPLIIQRVTDALQQWPKSADDCIVLARAKFDEFFSHSILQLLHNIPLDRVDAKGQLFWSGAKKPPTAATFGSGDCTMQVEFVMHLAELFAIMYALPPLQLTQESASAMAARVPSAPFVPRVVKYVVAETETTDTQTSQMTGEPSQILPPPELFAGRRMVPQTFEKDDDQNHHIDFVTLTSNLRAANYAIPAADRFKTKMIAGKIIPAMVTTTSLVTGLVMLESLKFLAGVNTLAAYRNAFVNIALPFFGFAEPIQTVSKQYQLSSGASISWGIWDRIDLNMGRDVTIKEFLKALNDKYELEVDMVTLEAGKLLYSSFGKNDPNALVSRVAEMRGTDLTKADFINFIATGYINDTEAEVPLIRYKFRNF